MNNSYEPLLSNNIKTNIIKTHSDIDKQQQQQQSSNCMQFSKLEWSVSFEWIKNIIQYKRTLLFIISA